MSYKCVRPLREYQGQTFGLDDFAQAKALLPKLLLLPKDGTVHTALSAITRALIEGSWEIRFLLYLVCDGSSLWASRWMGNQFSSIPKGPHFLLKRPRTLKGFLIK